MNTAFRAHNLSQRWNHPHRDQHTRFPFSLWMRCSRERTSMFWLWWRKRRGIFSFSPMSTGGNVYGLLGGLLPTLISPLRGTTPQSFRRRYERCVRMTILWKYLSRTVLPPPQKASEPSFPMNRISMCNSVGTVFWMCSTIALASAKVASPVLMRKFVCFGDTSTPPIL